MMTPTILSRISMYPHETDYVKNLFKNPLKALTSKCPKNGKHPHDCDCAFYYRHVVYVIHIRAPFFVRNIFKSRDTLKRSRSLIVRLVLCAAFYSREVLWKARDLCSRAFLWAQRFLFYSRQCEKSLSLFARLHLCTAFSIRESCWKSRDLYSRAFLWAQRFLFARQSEHSRSLFARWGVNM